MATDHIQFKDPTSLYKWAKTLILSTIGMCVIGIISGFMQHQLLEEIANGAYAYISDEEFYQKIDRNDQRQSIIGIMQVLIYIMQGIVILMWIYRANKNLRALGVQNMRFSAGWAVGWYFIPILSLWKPYQALKEILIKSENLMPGSANSKRSLLPIWWTLWIITEIVGRIILKSAMRNDLSLDGYITLNLFSITGDAIDLVLNIVFLLIISAIHNCQMAYKKQLSDQYVTFDTLIKQ